MVPIERVRPMAPLPIAPSRPPEPIDIPAFLKPRDMEPIEHILERVRVLSDARDTETLYHLAAPPEAKRIIFNIALKHRVPVGSMMGPRRYGPLFRARQEAIGTIAIAYPEWSLPRIGKLFNRDHTTILYTLAKLGIRRMGKVEAQANA
jgi:chromosomal replication initiation ATPase DnaA